MAISQREITNVLNQFVNEFYIYQSRCQLGKLEFTGQLLRQHFNQVFGIVSKQNTFFKIYDDYMNEKTKLKVWKKSTIKRYKNIKNLLIEFEKAYKFKVTFNRINRAFYREFTDFCYEYKKSLQ